MSDNVKNDTKCYCPTCVQFGLSSHPEESTAACGVCGIGGCPECDPNNDRCLDCDEYRDECECEGDGYELPENYFDEQVDAQKIEDARIKEKWKVLDEIIAGSKRKVTFHVDFKAKKVIKREES